MPATREGPGSELSVTTAGRTERAAAAVVRAGEHLPSDWEPVRRLLLRAEGVAFSTIEGLQAPLEEVAAVELGRQEGEAATWVADNLAVVAEALAEAADRAALDRRPCTAGTSG